MPFFTSPHNIRSLTRLVGLQVVFRMPRMLHGIHRSIMSAGQSLIPSVQNMGSISFYPREYPTNWSQIRRWVLKRDGYQCRVTWIDVYGIPRRCQNKKHLHVHHLTPLSEGGSSNAENLVTQCEEHHVAQHPHLRNYINHSQSESQPYSAYLAPFY